MNWTVLFEPVISWLNGHVTDNVNNTEKYNKLDNVA